MGEGHRMFCPNIGTDMYFNMGLFSEYKVKIN